MTYKSLRIKRHGLFTEDILIRKIQSYSIDYIAEQEMFQIHVTTNKNKGIIYIPKKELRAALYRERLT